MKKYWNVFLLAVILPAFVFTGCKDDTSDNPTPKGNYKVLSDYMASNGYDLPDLLSTPTNWIVAPTLMEKGGIVDPKDYSIPGYYVFDIRSADDFAKGHIKGAMNVALGDVLTKAKEVGKDKPILVVCYTGQTAARAVMALRLSGFPDAQVMKFGMSYWNPDFDHWTSNCTDDAAQNPNWVTDASAPLPSNDYPAWESTTTDGAKLLEERVNAMLQNGDWKIKADVVLNDPKGYTIYNFWKEGDYLKYGHFKDAYQMHPISMANDVIKAFPGEGQFLVYCYTGQTSSFTVAWLQVLGYKATSILFGVNAVLHSELVDGGAPSWHEPHDYGYVSESGM